MSKLSAQNLTEGSITKTLLVFAVPYLFANLIQAMYGAVDMIVVGWFANAAGISAVSVGSQVMQILTSMVAGLTMGSTILIAQYSGACREQATQRTIGTTLTLFALLAAVFTILLFILAPNVLQWLQTPVEAFDVHWTMSASARAEHCSSLGTTQSVPFCADLAIPKIR